MLHAVRQLRRRSLLACASTACLLALTGQAQAQGAAQGTDVAQVKFQTSAGDFVVELYPDKAPKTVANFLLYVKDKQYHGTIFHRVMDGFMIQGGGFTPDMVEKPTRAPIPLEARNGLTNDSYTIAMARTRVPDSATAQFFINVKNNTSLNAPMPDGHGYAVFGKVVSGTAVIDTIKSVPTGNHGMHQNVPLRPVTIIAATQIQ